MRYTRNRHYDQYSLAYKLQAILLASLPNVLTKDIDASFGGSSNHALSLEHGTPQRQAVYQQLMRNTY